MVGEVSLYVPNIEKASENRWSEGLRFSVSGKTTRIAELRDSSDNLRARVWFTKLRSGGGIYATSTADILKIEMLGLEPCLYNDYLPSHSGNNTVPVRNFVACLRGIFCAKKNGSPYFRHCTTIIGIESLTSMFGMGIGVTFRLNHRKDPDRPIRPVGA